MSCNSQQATEIQIYEYNSIETWRNQQWTFKSVLETNAGSTLKGTILKKTLNSFSSTTNHNTLSSFSLDNDSESTAHDACHCKNTYIHHIPGPVKGLGGFERFGWVSPFTVLRYQTTRCHTSCSTAFTIALQFIGISTSLRVRVHFHTGVAASEV